MEKEKRPFWVRLDIDDAREFSILNPDVTLQDFLDLLFKSSCGVKTDYDFINKLIAEAKDYSQKKRDAANTRWEKERLRRVK